MRAWNLIAAAVCCAGLARADEVLLRDGTRIEGKVILDTKGGALCVQLANKGARLVERDEVQEVVADDDPLTYVRFHRYSDTWSRLEVLNRTLESADGKRRVSLVGAVHVADRRYYRRVQQILDRHDVVLYEGVGPEQDRGLGEVRLPSAERRAEELAQPAQLGQLSWTDATSKDSITLMQTTMAETLELTFQKNGVDYSHSWWFSADVTVEELQGMFQNGQNSAMLSALTAGLDPKRQAAMNLLVGRALSEAAKGILGPKPMQLVLKEACADLLATQFSQLPDQAPSEASSDFDRAIILGRNRVVMQRFKELEAHPEARTIAIFYGAGHYPDLETQLVAQGYTRVRDEWLPAWVMEPEPELEPEAR